MQFKTLLAALAAVAIAFTGCEKKNDAQGAQTPAAQNGILGAGATFPYPFYSKLFNEYHKLTNTQVNYQSIGSGGGVKQFLARTVDFGATDAFMSDEELQKAGEGVIHVPTCLGAVVLAYNLPGVTGLKLTPAVLADIFLGKITTWNDAAIAAINPGLTLPATPITVVRRSDGSGTTAVFTDYLSQVSPEWKSKVGAGKAVEWPAGLGAKGNEGVAGMLQKTQGTIGYTELSYSKQGNMSVAAIQNSSGNFVEPSIASVTQSANVEVPADTRVSLVNTKSPNGYPISGFTWILLWQNQKDEAKGKQLVDLAWWMTHEGQQFAEALHYAPLPQSVIPQVEKLIASVQSNGKALR
jgi:phosphate transport system substrate-binding protein